MASNKTIYSDFSVTDDFTVKNSVIKTVTDGLFMKEKNISLQSGDEASIMIGESSMTLDLGGNRIMISPNDISLIKGTQQLLINDEGVQVSKLVTADVQTASGLEINNDGATNVQTPIVIREGVVYKYVISSDVVNDAPRLIQFGVLIGDSSPEGHTLIEETIVGARAGEKIVIGMFSNDRDTQLKYNADLTGPNDANNNTYRFVLTEL